MPLNDDNEYPAQRAIAYGKIIYGGIDIWFKEELMILKRLPNTEGKESIVLLNLN